jgi:hypothetical protein
MVFCETKALAARVLAEARNGKPLVEGATLPTTRLAGILRMIQKYRSTPIWEVTGTPAPVN